MPRGGGAAGCNTCARAMYTRTHTHTRTRTHTHKPDMRWCALAASLLAMGAFGRVYEPSACTTTYRIVLQRNLTVTEAGNAVCFRLNSFCELEGLGNLTSADIVAGSRKQSTFQCAGCEGLGHATVAYRAASEMEKTFAIAIIVALSVLGGAWRCGEWFGSEH